jgi:hypothetical protein
MGPAARLAWPVHAMRQDDDRFTSGGYRPAAISRRHEFIIVYASTILG